MNRNDYPLVEKLEELKKKYATLSDMLSSSEAMADMKKYIQLNREYKELEPIVAAADKYIKIITDFEAAKEILSVEKDEDLRELAKEEVATLESMIPQMEEEIKLLLIPKDPQDEKNAMVEIRGGTGGDEAAIFAGGCMPNSAKGRDGSLRSAARARALQVVTRRLSSRLADRVSMVSSNTKVVSIACSACHRLKLRDVCIHRHLLW